MPSQIDVLAGVLESIAATLVLVPVGYFVKWVTEHPATYPRDISTPQPQKAIELPDGYPATAPLDERLSWLAYRASEQSPTANGPEGDALVSRCSSILENLSFLTAGDEVSFREETGPEYMLTLEHKLGDGSAHQTWAAVGTNGKRMAVRFLKELSDFAADRDNFFATARLNNQASRAGADLPLIIFNSLPGKRSLPAHYGRDLIEGESLRSHKARIVSQGAFEEKLAVGIAELAETLSVLEEQGISLASLSPEGVLVRRLGGWRLVDLDYAVDTNRYSPRSTVRTINVRYAPPEVFLGDTPGPQAHSYCLARIILFMYWSSDELPSPYEALSSRVVDQVNCGLFMKRVLRKATCR